MFLTLAKLVLDGEHGIRNLFEISNNESTQTIRELNEWESGQEVKKTFKKKFYRRRQDCIENLI